MTISKHGVIRPHVSFSIRMFPGDHFFLKTTQPLFFELSRKSCDEERRTDNSRLF